MSAYRNIFIIISAIGISVNSVGQIGAKTQQQGKIYGLWENNQFGYQMTLMLNPDGSGEFDGELIKHAAQGNHLFIIMGGTKTDYSYVLQGNSLTLSGGDLDGQVVFARNGAAAESQTKATASYSNTSTELLGIWSGNGEMIEFKADGNCTYLGNIFPYQVSQGHVILSTNQGNVSFAYSVKGTALTLTANGQHVVYNKSEGPATGTPAGSVKAGGSVAMELIGQWCFMNMNTNSQTSRCITLNGDGTYTYAAESSRSVNTNEFYGGTSSQGNDRGTWYVQGDRIYYQSQTSGQGSYKLEKRNHPKNVNDPMIVLDGEPYVTSTLRAPWR